MSFGLSHSSCILKQVQTAACKGRSTALFSGMQTGSPSLRCQKWDLSPAWTSYATLLQVSPWASSNPLPMCLTGLNVTVTAASFFQILPFPFFIFLKMCSYVFSLPPFFSSKPLSLTLQNRFGDTPNAVSTGHPHNSNHSSPSSAVAGCWKGV